MTRRSSRRRGRSGSVLLEALIAAAVLLVVLALAAELLAESGRRLAVELARTREPIGWALARLEADVRLAEEARIVADPDGPWPMLRLDGHPAGRVEWRRSLGELRRRVERDGESGEAVVLRRVRSFVINIRALPDDDLVEVDLTVGRMVRASGFWARPAREAGIEKVRAVAAPRREAMP